MGFDDSKTIGNKVFLLKSICVMIIVIGGFLLNDLIHIGPAAIAFFGAALLLLISGKKPEEYFIQVEWITIFFFAGLFIMVGTLEDLKIIEFLGKKMIGLSGNNIRISTFTILWGSGFLSGIIDNIPFVATMIPMVKVLNTSFGISAGNVLWWSLSTGACLGGNFTLIGSSANVISAGIASKNGYKISFMDFTKYGVIYTVISLIVTSGYMFIHYLI